MDWKHHFILLKETILLSGLFCHLVTQVDKKTINRSRCFKGLVCSTVHQMFLDLGVRSKRGVMPFFPDSPCLAVTKCKNSLNSLLRRGNFELISQRVGCPKMHHVTTHWTLFQTANIVIITSSSTELMAAWMKA